MTQRRVALVTGGSRGIGRAISVQLARDGFDVAIGYERNEPAAGAVVREVQSLGCRGVELGANLADPTAAGQLVSRVVSELGRLDALASNAGCLRSGAFLVTSAAEYDAQMETNARGAFFVAQAAARQMIDQQSGGRIVFVTSKSAVRPTANLAVYAMSKASLKILMEAAAIELAPHNITVNAVAPGTIKTDLNRTLLRDPTMRRHLMKTILLTRPGAPEDVANVVSFLFSRRADFITGASIAVDGGSAISPDILEKT